MVPDQAPDDKQLAAPGTPQALIAATDAVHKHFARRSFIATISEVITRVTLTYLDTLDPQRPPEPGLVESQLLGQIGSIIRAENQKTKIAAERLPVPRTLDHWQIAQVMLRLHRVVRINFAGSTKVVSPIAIYASDGPDEGIHVVDETRLRQLARRYRANLSTKDFQEVVAVLEEEALRVRPCRDRDLIGVNNGIFDYRTKELRPFDPSIVLLAKIRIDYVESASNPVIRRADGTTWDVESWMSELSDDLERVSLGWHGLGAMVRPNVRWGKALMLYNENGNNGKGTYMSLGRNLVGEDSWGGLSIEDFEAKFRLPEIVNKTAFGADENSVGQFTEKMANFKAVITNDAVTIERKNKDPYLYVPQGLMVQCINSLPKSKDVSQSYYRRLLFWPFDKSFEGREDKAIRDDYLKRQEVLEYVLRRVLNLPDYYELPEPAASKAALAEFKRNNDMVREFWDEIEDALAWGLLPQAFLHDLFVSWAARTNPRGGALKKLEFYNRLKLIVAEGGRWEDGQWGTSTLMDDAELMIAEYDLDRWMNPKASGSANPLKKAHPGVLQKKYRGLRRCSPVSTAPDDDQTTTTDD